jgi:hypothetical protein
MAALLNCFGVANPAAPSSLNQQTRVAFYQSASPGIDPIAVSAWLREEKLRGNRSLRNIIGNTPAYSDEADHDSGIMPIMIPGWNRSLQGHCVRSLSSSVLLSFQLFAGPVAASVYPPSRSPER